MKKLIMLVCACVFNFMIIHGVFAASESSKTFPPMEVAKLISGEQALVVGYHPTLRDTLGDIKVNPEQHMIVDIFREVAKRVGIKKIKFVPLKLNTSKSFFYALEKGQVNVLTGVWVSPGVEKQFSLTMPYFTKSGVGFLYLKGNGPFQAINDLKEHTLGILKNDYFYIHWLANLKVSPRSVKSYDTVEEVISALKRHEIDMFANGFVFLSQEVNSMPSQLDAVLVDPIVERCALRKQDKALRDLLNKTLKSMWADGSLYQIAKKYLAPLGIEPARSIND